MMEMDIYTAQEMLTQIEYQLNLMLRLAERSASSECTDAEREKLQQTFVAIRQLLECTTEHYTSGGQIHQESAPPTESPSEIAKTTNPLVGHTDDGIIPPKNLER